MAFGDTIATGHASGSAGFLVNILVTISPPATAGNLLVAGVVVDQAKTYNTPSGWNLLTKVESGNMSAAWFYKIAAGGESSVDMSWTAASATARGAYAEFEGPFAATPLDQTAENEASVSTAVTSVASGTTATTAQANELAVAFFGSDAASTVTDGRGYTNSFTEALFAHATTDASRPAAIFAKRVLAATGTFSTTFSTSDTGDEMYGAIATFKGVATGTTLTPSAGAATLTGHSAGLGFTINLPDEL